ncbi:MAG: VWA domain-containing protein [Planctomycetota bacterium]|nr:MAG: VWA domain-containing protein [Planctomycetota bacterium]
MRHRYFPFNGRKFQFQSDLDFGGQFLDFVLTYGEEALRAMQQIEQDPEHSDMLEDLLREGLLEKIKGRFRLTPRAVNAMQRKALMEIFTHLKRGRSEGHESPEPGAAGERIEGNRPYEFGDPVSEIDAAASLRNALRRRAAEHAQRPNAGDRSTGSLLPLRLGEQDLERYESESRASCSTVVLIDQSGSMARFGRFLAAKKTAMALIALIRQRFPFDTVDLVGFASFAEPVLDEKLPLLMPKPVTMYDPVIRLRVPLNRAADAPPHFTNLHMGLLTAKRILQRRAGDNKMIFIITDGQPTAHVRGDYAYLLYPPSEESHITTLKEALLIARRGVRICTFALTDDYWDMDWLGFVDELGRLTRGVTFHCASGDLSSCVMESYLSGRRRRTFIA